MKILLVDDSKTMRLLERRALRQAGYGESAIEEASDGAQGLLAVRSFCPDIVFSDWNMPNMNGIDFLKGLRAEGNKVRFVFVTSEATPEVHKLALDEGAAAVITKPFAPEVFGAQISKSGPASAAVQTQGMPTTNDIQRLLAGLFDKALTVKANPPVVATPAMLLGVYQGDDGNPGVVCACAPALAAAAGAALAMVPARIAQEAAKTGKVPENLAENFQEVLNVMARLFNQDDVRHVIFRQLVCPPAPRPDAAAALLARPSSRLDLMVTVGDYGGGTMSFFVT